MIGHGEKGKRGQRKLLTPEGQGLFYLLRLIVK
jgi:hypothetical protein